MPGLAGECAVQRLVNASELQAFEWRPCPGIEGCEDAVFNPRIANLTTREFIFPGSIATEDDVGLLGLVIAPHAIFTDLSGQVIDGYRPFWDETPGCATPTASAWKGRYGLKVGLLEATGLHGGILHSVGEPGRPTLATIDLGSTTGGPNVQALGDSRWSWTWALPSRLYSVSADDGSDVRLYSQPSETVFDMGGEVATGGSFLFDLLTSAGPIVAKSDGIVPPEQFAPPPSGHAAFAHSHVAWLKGINEIEPYKFETVEIWAVLYEPDLGTEGAYVVADLEKPNFSSTSAGWGHFVIPGVDGNRNVDGIRIWNLVTKAEKRYILPPERVYYQMIGVTKEYAWVLGMQPYHLMRFKVE